MKQVAFDTRARPSVTNVKFDVNVKNTFVDVGRAPVQQGRRTAPPSLATVQALAMEDLDLGTPVSIGAAAVNGAGSRRGSGVSDVGVGLTLPIGGHRSRVSTAGSDMTSRTGAGTTRNRRFSWDETPDASCLYSLSSHAHGFYLPPGVGAAAPAAAVAGPAAPARGHPCAAAAAAPPAYFPGYPGCAAPYHPHWSMPVSFPMHMPPGPFYHPGMQYYPNGYPACAADPAYAAAAATAAGAAAAAGGAYGERPRLELGSLLPGQAAAKRQHAAKPGIVIQHPHARSSFDEAATTVMLRNIPVKYTREMVLADLDMRGFHATYDFFYLPIDFQTGNTVGYAFINFVSEAETLRFRSVYSGLQLSPDSAKICEVSDAKAQGRDKNVEQYRNSSVMAMEDKYHPVVFQNGVRALFPPPTRLIKPVKPRQKGQ